MTHKSLIFSFVSDEKKKFSTSPELADLMHNMIVLDHVLATMFKTSGTGTPRRSAITAWSSSPDGLTWELTVKSGLKDAKGSSLTPTYWCEGIKKNLQKLPSPEKMILLSGLNGWSQYIENKSAFPVICDDDKMKLTFAFKEKPDGILEYLSMPILGFWNSTDNETFVETGDYRLKSITDSSVELSPVRGANPIEFDVIIRSKTYKDISIEGMKPNEILFPLKPIESLINKSRSLKTSPTRLVFAELNPKSKSLSSSNIRERVFEALYRYKKNEPNSDTNATQTSSIFFDSTEGFVEPIPKKDITKIKLLRVLVSGGKPTTPNSDYIHRMISISLSPLVNEIEMIYSASGSSYKETVALRDYDIRFASVDAGTFPDKWVAQMMFCTKQGISFVDYNSEVCNFLSKESNSDPMAIGIHINKTISQNFTILPLYNTSYLLYLGEHINDSKISSNSPLIRFEQVGFLDNSR